MLRKSAGCISIKIELSLVRFTLKYLSTFPQSTDPVTPVSSPTCVSAMVDNDNTLGDGHGDVHAKKHVMKQAKMARELEELNTLLEKKQQLAQQMNANDQTISMMKMEYEVRILRVGAWFVFGDTWGAIMIGGGKAGKLYVKDQVICEGGGSVKGNGIVGSMIKARKSHKEENQTEMGS